MLFKPVALIHWLTACRADDVTFPMHQRAAKSAEENFLPSLPTGYSSSFVDDTLIIKHAWSRGMALALAVATVLPLVVVIAANPPWPVKIVAAGVMLNSVYLAFAFAFNVTRFTVSADLLEIRTRPFPVRGAVKLRSTEIDQIFVQEKSKGKRKGKRRATTHQLVVKPKGSSAILVPKQARSAYFGSSDDGNRRRRTQRVRFSGEREATGR